MTSRKLNTGGVVTAVLAVEMILLLILEKDSIPESPLFYVSVYLFSLLMTFLSMLSFRKYGLFLKE